MTVTAEREQENQDAQPSLSQGVAVLLTTSRSNVAGVIRDMQPHALTILVQQPLPERTAVMIEFGAVCSKGEIIACRPKGRRYEVTVVNALRSEPDLRRAERFPMTEEVRIRPAHSESEVEAMIVDLSEHGIGLELSTPIEIGEIVTLERASNVAFGVVRHCSLRHDGRFRAGVEVFHMMPTEGTAPEHESAISKLGHFFHSPE
jgi:hypothetical protein